jgi:hypothetical protein
MAGGGAWSIGRRACWLLAAAEVDREDVAQTAQPEGVSADEHAV